MHHRTTALIVAAGQGSRVGAATPKQYLPIAGRAGPGACDRCAGGAIPAIDAVRVVIGAGQEDSYAQAIGDRVAPTRRHRRRDTPRVGRQRDWPRSRAVASACSIHDAARPFVPAHVIDRLLGGAESRARRGSGAAGGGYAGGGRPHMLGVVVPRERLARVQTPQAFRLDAIRLPIAAWDPATKRPTMPRWCAPPEWTWLTVEGSPLLDKLTVPSDFEAAERRLRPRSFRAPLWASTFTPLPRATASGWAASSFPQAGAGRPFGCRRRAPRADRCFVRHDRRRRYRQPLPALRSAMARRGLASVPRTCRDKVLQAGGRIDHCRCDDYLRRTEGRPASHGDPDIDREILKIAESQVSVKATTTEQLGFTGRREGIAAQAAATIRLPEVAVVKRPAFLALALRPAGHGGAQTPPAHRLRCIHQDQAAALVTFALAYAGDPGARRPLPVGTAPNSLSDRQCQRAGRSLPPDSRRRLADGTARDRRIFSQFLGQPMPAEMNSDAGPHIGRADAGQGCSPSRFIRRLRYRRCGDRAVGDAFGSQRSAGWRRSRRPSPIARETVSQACSICANRRTADRASPGQGIISDRYRSSSRTGRLARRVIEENRAAGRRIAVAESCTGGLVSAALTEIPGSSDVFDAGFVTYSNEAKMRCSASRRM
jgi:2-C-methyl-D-erythritol 4-phosphate cytidylyltransferase/2-C-methyl-D-erythritol 2,4-cyclodiphosphate synthase